MFDIADAALLFGLLSIYFAYLKDDEFLWKKGFVLIGVFLGMRLVEKFLL